MQGQINDRRARIGQARLALEDARGEGKSSTNSDTLIEPQEHAVNSRPPFFTLRTPTDSESHARRLKCYRFFESFPKLRFQPAFEPKEPVDGGSHEDG